MFDFLPSSWVGIQFSHKLIEMQNAHTKCVLYLHDVYSVADSVRTDQPLLVVQDLDHGEELFIPVDGVGYAVRVVAEVMLHFYLAIVGEVR